MPKLNPPIFRTPLCYDGIVQYSTLQILRSKPKLKRRSTAARCLGRKRPLITDKLDKFLWICNRHVLLRTSW